MSPFKSEAQRRKFHSLVKQGKISKSKLAEWERDTPKYLPERARKKRKKKLRRNTKYPY